MKKISAVWASVMGLFFSAIIAGLIIHVSEAPENEMETTLKHFRQLAEKTEPNSMEAVTLARKIRRIEKRLGMTEKFEHPDEFARILFEMRIPAGADEPSYQPNYKYREFVKAMRLRKKSSLPLPWIERGPGNVPGRVRGLAVDPEDPTGNTWFVGAVGGGIWKTTNAGSSWTELAPDLPVLSVSSIAIAQSDPDIIYAGTGESMFNVDVVNGDGIFKSTDHGQSWFQLPGTVSNYNFQNIARLIVDPDNPDVVLAATTAGRYRLSFFNQSGIFKSTDGGITWTRVYRETVLGGSSRIKKVLQITETPGNFNVLYAGVDEKGILKSTNAGDSWFLSSAGITDSSGRFEIAVSPSNPNKVYASAEGTNSLLYVSTNAGETWINTTTSGSTYNWLSSQGWYDNTITVHPYNENIVFVGGVYLYQITMISSSVKTITPLSTGPVHVDQHNLLIIKGSNGTYRILNSNDGGLGLSADSSENWIKPTDGLNTSQFYGIDKMPGEDAYVGGMQDNGTWRSPINSLASSPWTFQIGGDGYETSWHFNDPLKIIGASQYNGIQRSVDGGLSYTSATSGLTNTGSSSAPFITKIAKTNAVPDLLFAVGSSGVFRSTNFGENWTLSSITGTNWGSISSFADVEISKANPDIVWAGMRMDASGKINVSVNRGLNFSPAVNYSLTTMGGISGMATHPYEDSTAYVLFSFAHKPKILRTTDLGQTWSDISGFHADTISSNGFPDVPVYDLLVLPNEPEKIWAGTEIGLFESDDNGVSWHAADNGLPAVCIWDMNQVEDQVIVGTHGRGVWSVTIPGLSGDQTFTPLIKNLYQSTNGELAINLKLRSSYDSSVVIRDGLRVYTHGANGQPLDTTLFYPVTQDAAVSVVIQSYKNGTLYSSVSKTISVITFQPAGYAYASDFNGTNNDFTGNGFSMSVVSGFSDKAIHSVHNYPDNVNYVYQLKMPVIVDSATAYLAYDDVALVEPGEPGSVYGDADFYDYVVVEATQDGINWAALADGYDARYDAAWLSAFNSSGSGNSGLYRHHEINLLDQFNHGDHILIRFRLFADGGVTGWGWSVDNLEIQQRIVSVNEGSGVIPMSLKLYQNYPNPFNPSTTIKYDVPDNGIVTIKVYNSLGQEIATLLNQYQRRGSYQAIWNGRNERGDIAGSGLYLYRITAGNKTQVRKMMFIK